MLSLLDLALRPPTWDWDFPIHRPPDPPVDIVFCTTSPSGKKVVTKRPRQEDFKLEFPVKRYKPEDLKVNLDGHELIVEGSHKEKSEDGLSTFSSNFHQRVTIPKEIDLETLTTCYDEKGTLSISAKPKVFEQKKLKSIPIDLKTEKSEDEKESSKMEVDKVKEKISDKKKPVNGA